MGLISYLILAITDRCNLKCTYCYRDADTIGRDMEGTVAENMVAQIDQAGPAHIQITGGEPLLLPQLVERIGEKARAMQSPPHIGLQTNGTLLTEPIAAMLKRLHIQVGISLDGPPAIHNRQRGKAEQTLKGLRLLESMGVEFRVTAVVTQDNVDKLDQLALLLAGFSNSRGLGLDLVVSQGRGKKNLLPSPQSLEEGLLKLMKTFRFINTNRAVPLHLREMDHLLGKTGPFCYAALGKSLAVSPGGTLYPCGQTLYDPEFLLGHVDRGGWKATSSLCCNLLTSPGCCDCPLQGKCPGECPSRLQYNGPQAHRLACTMYRTLSGEQVGGYDES